MGVRGHDRQAGCLDPSCPQRAAGPCIFPPPSIQPRLPQRQAAVQAPLRSGWEPGVTDILPTPPASAGNRNLMSPEVCAQECLEVTTWQCDTWMCPRQRHRQLPSALSPCCFSRLSVCTWCSAPQGCAGVGEGRIRLGGKCFCQGI